MGVFEDIGYSPGLTMDTDYGIGGGLFESIGYEPTLPLYEEEEAITPRPVEEEEEADFWGGLQVFGRQLPSMISDVIPNTFYTAARGGPDDLVDKGLLDRWITENKEERERVKTLTPEEREKTWFKIPFTDKKVSFGDAEDAADSIGYSLANMAVTFTAQKIGKALGAPLGPIGSTIAGIGLGFTAGTFTMQRASKDQFLDMARDEFLKKNQGKEITPALEAQWQKLREQLDDDADWYGFWEAAPETAGNLLTLGIAKLPLGKLLPGSLKKTMANTIGKSVAGKAAVIPAKLGAMITEEAMTETVTAKKQSEIEFRNGLRDKPLSYAEAFDEVLPMVITTTPFLGGVVGGATSIAKRRADQAAALPVEEELLEEEAPARPPPLPPSFAPEAFQAIALTPEMQQEITAFEQGLTDAQQAEAENIRRQIEQGQVEMAVEEERALAPEQFARISPRYEAAAIEEAAGLAVRDAVRLKRPSLEQHIDADTGQFIKPAPVSDLGYQDNKRLINSLVNHFETQEIQAEESQTPLRYRSAFTAMQDELAGAQPRVATVVGPTKEEERIVVTPTSYPAWFTEKFDIGDVDADDKPRLYQFSIKDFNNVLQKVEQGKKLTGRQNQMYNRIKEVGEDMRSFNPEVYIQAEVDMLEAEGFEIMADNLPIAEFELGDQVAIQEDGGVEKYRLVAEDDGRGNAILSNPQSRRVLDTFDTVPVVGIKRANYWQNIYDMGGTVELEAARARPMLREAEQSTLRPESMAVGPTMRPEGVERREVEGRKDTWTPEFRKMVLEARGQNLDAFIDDGKKRIKTKDRNFLELMTRYGKRIDKDTPIPEALKIVHARIVGGMEPMKKVAEMTEAEKDAFIVTDYLTGLRNKYAFEVEDAEWPAYAAIDLDGLKAVNDNLGHAAGDGMLIEFGEAMRESGLDPKNLYHVSGDEYWIGSDNGPVILEALIKMEKYLDKNGLTVYTDNIPKTYRIGFSYGRGKTRQEAERALQASKATRRRQNKDSARGVLPEELPQYFTEGERGRPERPKIPEKVKPTPPGVKPTPTPIPVPLRIKPETIPADLTVKVKMVHDQTGKTITVDENAKEALRSIEGQIESHYTLLGCLG